MCRNKHTSARFHQAIHIGNLWLGGDLDVRRRSWYEVVLGKGAVNGEPDRCEQVPLSGGAEARKR